MFFKKKLKYSLELIKATSDGLIVFDPSLYYITNELYNLHQTFGVYDDKDYRLIYKEYQKHYKVYDLAPRLLHVKALYIFLNTYNIEHLNVHTLIDDHYIDNPKLLTESISQSFLPSEKLVDCITEMYIKACSYVNKPAKFDTEHAKAWVYFTWLSHWERLTKNSIYRVITRFIEYHINLLILNSYDDTKITVKNIIERHLENSYESCLE